MRGATRAKQQPKGESIISIHAPHAGRDSQTTANNLNAVISIHAPHAGRDGLIQPWFGVCWIFQSTRPMRGATTTLSTALLPQGFQSTRPMRGATKNAFRRADGKQFQSTRPMRGATGGGLGQAAGVQISIHAPHAGRDFGSPLKLALNCLFQSTRPMRGATA